MEKFYCDKCGLCCKNLNSSDLYDDLNRGDGICKHFDENNNTCTIYENRPLKCRVDEMYKKYFSKMITLEEYYQLNYDSCNALKEKSEQ